MDTATAAHEIRRLSRLKGYPRSWEGSGDSASEQDAQAESALIDAAAAAPDVTRLRQFVTDWERRHVEAPVPATLYEAWRTRDTFSGVRRQRCPACGDSGWVTRHYVVDAIAGGHERIPIPESEVEDWWERIRQSAKTCAQRVYAEAARCGCQGGPAIVPADPRADEMAYSRFREAE